MPATVLSGARRTGLPVRPGPGSLRPGGVGLSRGGARPGPAAACVWVLLPGFWRAGFCPGSPLPQTFVLTGNVVLLEGGASRERGRAGGTPGTSVGFDCPGGQLRSHLGSSQGWLSVQGGATNIATRFGGTWMTQLCVYVSTVEKLPLNE